MRISRHWAVTGVLLVTCIALTGSQREVWAQTIELGGRTVSMELVKASDLSPAPGQSGVNLQEFVYRVRRGDRIGRLLHTAGVRPDVEAITLIYDLNPGLTSADELRSGSRLKLVRASGPNITTRLRSGYIVLLTVDRQLKDGLKRDVAELHVLSHQFGSLIAERFENRMSAQASVDAVQELVRWFDVMSTSITNRTGPALRRETLRQLHDEANALRTLLRTMLTSAESIRDDDLMSILSIKDDISAETKKFDEVLSGALPDAEPHITVRAFIQGGDPSQISRLRVYYVVNGLFSDPPQQGNPFPELGSGASKALPIKNYVLWAAADGDPTNPRTAPLRVQVRSPREGHVISITLSLNPR